MSTERRRRILWLDDDVNLQGAFREQLEEDGYEVTAVARGLEAQQLLLESIEGYDLLILDNMIPTKDEEEELEFPPHKNDTGLEMGLYFYKKHKRWLDLTGTPVLVFSQRADQRIIDGFYDAGLPLGAYQTKFNLIDLDDFMAKIEELVRR
jgi:CheY-like chemotaxis protein